MNTKIKNNTTYFDYSDNDIKERITKARELKKSIDSKEKAIKILIQLGIHDKKGKLTQNFGG